jgi:hypothetical protein
MTRSFYEDLDPEESFLEISEDDIDTLDRLLHLPLWEPMEDLDL